MDRTIFLDLRGTLGSVRCFDTGPVLEVYPFMRSVRTELASVGARLGIVCGTCAPCNSDEGALRRMLEAASISDWFEPELCLFGATNAGEIFQRARATGGASSWYVSRDAVACAWAQEAGLVPVPHGLLARAVATGQKSSYVMVFGAGAATRVEGVHTPGVVALDLISPETAYAVVTETGIATLIAAGLRVEPLDERLSATVALVRVRDHRVHDARGVLTAWEGLLPDPRAIVARTPEAVYLAIAARDATHHTGIAHHAASQVLTADSTLTVGGMEAPAPSGATGWTDAEKVALRAISAAEIAENVSQLVSNRVALAVVGGPEVERGPTVAWLEGRLRALGLEVARHCFTYRGEQLHNVEAELAGSSSELVLVTVHLEPTNPREPRDITPATDDNTCGVAAVLAIAQAFVALSRASGKLRRTVRFVVFDAREAGLQGSSVYAHDEVLRDAKIAAVFQMNVIGHRANVEASRPCEIHLAAFPNSGVETRSTVLAAFLAEAVDAGIGASVQETTVYSTRIGDRARLRSAHSQFHLRDYAACSISDDLWLASPRSPSHKSHANYEYAADIARLVAAATMRAATADTA